MNTMITTLIVFTGLLSAAQAHADMPTTVNGVTTIQMDEYNGYFAVSNKAKKLVGFLIQDDATHQRLDMFPIEPGKTKTTVVKISENGFRFRCPLPGMMSTSKSKPDKHGWVSKPNHSNRHSSQAGEL